MIQDFVSQDRANSLVRTIIIIVAIVWVNIIQVSYLVGFYFQKFSYCVYSVLVAMAILVLVFLMLCRLLCQEGCLGGISHHVGSPNLNRKLNDLDKNISNDFCHLSSCKTHSFLSKLLICCLLVGHILTIS